MDPCTRACWDMPHVLTPAHPRPVGTVRTECAVRRDNVPVVPGAKRPLLILLTSQCPPPPLLQVYSFLLLALGATHTAGIPIRGLRNKRRLGSGRTQPSNRLHRSSFDEIQTMPLYAGTRGMRLDSISQNRPGSRT